MLNAKLFLMLLMTPAMAMATSLAPYFNFDGVLTDSSGTPVTTANTPVKFRVMDPTGTCLLYEETQNVSPGADGSISVLVGSEVGNGKRTGGFVSYSWAKIFSNMGSYPTNTGCSSGWTPAPNDSRVLQVVVNSTTLSPNYALAAVPMATVAETLNGKQASDFLQFNMTAPVQLNQTNLESVFSGSNYTNLLNVLAGNVMQTNPTAPVSFNNQKITNVAAPVAATDAVNKSYADTAMGGKSLDFTGVNGTTGNGYTIIWDQTNNRWTTGPASATDNTKLPLVGGYLTGFLDMGSNPIQAVGHITMSSQKALTIGKFDNTQEAAFVPTLNASNAGATWYNSNTQKLRIYNGSTAVDVGGGGSGDFKADGSVPMTNSLIAWAGVAASPSYTFAGASNTGMFYGGAGSLAFSTANSERVRIDSAGNVGINNTTPSARLSIVDSSDNQFRMESNGSTQTTTAIWTSSTKNYAIQLGGSSSAMPDRFYIKDQSAGVTRLTINNTGSVGINTTAPATGAVFDAAGTGPALSSILVPRDTTANQPAPVNGMIRYNTSTNTFEGVQGGVWAPFASAVMASPMSFPSGSPVTPSLTFNGDTNTGISSPSADNLVLSTNGSDRLHIDASGNIGVGTSTPGYKFDFTFPNSSVYAPNGAAPVPAGATDFFRIANSSNTTGSGSYLMYEARNGGGSVQNAYVAAISSASGYSPSLVFGARTSAAAYAERMRIDANGYVGIGTTAPMASLHVHNLSGQDSVVLSRNNNSTDLASILFEPSGTISASNVKWSAGMMPASNNFILSSFDGSTNKVALALGGPTGYVGIGTPNPSAPIHVATNNMSVGLLETVNSQSILGFKDSTTTTNPALGSLGDSLAFYANGYGSPKMIIAPNGNIGIGGILSPSSPLQVGGNITPGADNAFSLGNSGLRFSMVYAVNGTINTSDARLKKDVAASNLGLEFVNALRPVSYKWKDGEQSVHYGLIAQETERTIRSMGADSAGIVDYDKESDRYGVRYTELISPIIKAVQELSAYVISGFTRHDQEIAALRKENEDLRARLEAVERALQK